MFLRFGRRGGLPLGNKVYFVAVKLEGTRVRSSRREVASAIVVGLLVVACASTPSPSTTPNSTSTSSSSGAPTSTSVPTTPVGAAPRVVQVAAGFDHTCVLRADGGVKCWGSNAAGQLGNGTPKQTFVPGAVDVVGLVSGVTAISAGNFYACALTSGGGVKCWGSNSAGQLGGNEREGGAPGDVVGLSGVAAVDVHGSSCALTNGGGVKCWGANNSGQLGNKTTTDSWVPVSVSGLASGISAISVGGEHACALTSGGGVKCWGSNGHGQLGDNSPNDRGVPVNVAGLASGVSAIASGQGHSCALMTGGTVKCWGNWRILGNTGAPIVARPADVAGLEAPVSAIAAGGLHTCALMSTGGVQCWGDNEQGQLGTGTTTPPARPEATPPPNPGAGDVSGLTSGISAISAGENHTCAITNDGEVKCWGSNFAGQLNADEPEVSAVPLTLDTETPPSPPPAAALPVHGSAREMGEGVLMAPGPNGTLLVSIPRPMGSVLALLDGTGRLRPGWPIAIPGSTSCSFLFALEDGSVRAVCTLEDQGNMYAPVAAFAFDAQGGLLPGWPVDVGCCFAGYRMVGNDLVLLEVVPFSDVIMEGQPYAGLQLKTVAADGSRKSGAQVPVFDPCCIWTVGPDGVAYGTSIVSGLAEGEKETSRITALDATGTPTGWPLAFDGLASGPSVGPDGRITVTVGSLDRGASRVVVFDAQAKAVAGRSAEYPTSRADFGSVGGCSLGNPTAPLVAGDGTTFVLDWGDGAAFALDPSPKVKPGWPYRPASPLAKRDSRYVREDMFCPSLGLPAVGPDATIYLPLEPGDGTVGGSIVAVGPDSRLRAGWPVALQRRGSEFWAIVVGSGGTVYALTIEPESATTSSASVVAIAPDSTVLWTATIIDP